MSLFAAAPLATLLFFSGFADAQVYAPACTVASMASLGWTVNTLGQNACLVAAYLEATCFGGSFTLATLRPGYSSYYLGPSIYDGSDLCACNTVMYSLISACGACQGANWISWSEYTLNCTMTLPPSSFPNPVPSGTRVPLWALIDVTSDNIWDSGKAFAVGGTPEQAPGAIISSSGAAKSGTHSATSSLSGKSSSTVTPNSSPTSKNGSNTAVIVGATVGGVAVISLVIVIGFFLRRRRPEAPAPAVAPSVVRASQPPMDEIQQPLTIDDGYTTSSTSTPGTVGSSMPGTPVAPMRNDPNYPSAFPGYQGVPQSPATPQGAVPGVPSLNGTGSSLATMQTSRPQGYHGLPIV